jgi:2-C-methyl-D-erythritol 2,4-cyclodiphosphate synthase
MHRVGIGHDTHRLEAGRRLVIGGVVVPHAKGAVAHSDGDVLLHALIDALLGATGLGDIGEWFPDTAPIWAGADSARLLGDVVAKVRDQGWTIVNIDAIVFAQQPKLLPVKSQIRERLAELLALATDRINVKAKTGEHVGPIGREEAIAAEVVVLLERDD